MHFSSLPASMKTEQKLDLGLHLLNKYGKNEFCWSDLIREIFQDITVLAEFNKKRSTSSESTKYKWTVAQNNYYTYLMNRGLLPAKDQKKLLFLRAVLLCDSYVPDWSKQTIKSNTTFDEGCLTVNSFIIGPQGENIVLKVESTVPAIIRYAKEILKSFDDETCSACLSDDGINHTWTSLSKKEIMKRFEIAEVFFCDQEYKAKIKELFKKSFSPSKAPAPIVIAPPIKKPELPNYSKQILSLKRISNNLLAAVNEDMFKRLLKRIDELASNPLNDADRSSVQEIILSTIHGLMADITSHKLNFVMLLLNRAKLANFISEDNYVQLNQQFLEKLEIDDIASLFTMLSTLDSLKILALFKELENVIVKSSKTRDFCHHAICQIMAPLFDEKPLMNEMWYEKIQNISALMEWLLQSPISNDKSFWDPKMVNNFINLLHRIHEISENIHPILNLLDIFEKRHVKKVSTDVKEEIITFLYTSENDVLINLSERWADTYRAELNANIRPNGIIKIQDAKEKKSDEECELVTKTDVKVTITAEKAIVEMGALAAIPASNITKETRELLNNYFTKLEKNVFFAENSKVEDSIYERLFKTYEGLIKRLLADPNTTVVGLNFGIHLLGRVLCLFNKKKLIKYVDSFILLYPLMFKGCIKQRTIPMISVFRMYLAKHAPGLALYSGLDKMIQDEILAIHTLEIMRQDNWKDDRLVKAFTNTEHTLPLYGMFAPKDGRRVVTKLVNLNLELCSMIWYKAEELLQIAIKSNIFPISNEESRKNLKEITLSLLKVTTPLPNTFPQLINCLKRLRDITNFDSPEETEVFIRALTDTGSKFIRMICVNPNAKILELYKEDFFKGILLDFSKNLNNEQMKSLISNVQNLLKNCITYAFISRCTMKTLKAQYLQHGNEWQTFERYAKAALDFNLRSSVLIEIITFYKFFDMKVLTEIDTLELTRIFWVYHRMLCSVEEKDFQLSVNAFTTMADLSLDFTQFLIANDNDVNDVLNTSKHVRNSLRSEYRQMDIIGFNLSFGRRFMKLMNMLKLRAELLAKKPTLKEDKKEFKASHL